MRQQGSVMHFEGFGQGLSFRHHGESQNCLRRRRRRRRKVYSS